MAPPKQKTSVGARPPTNELGTILGGTLSPAGMAPWTRFVDEDEFVPALQWPLSNDTYNRMRTDAQLSALYKATLLGIMKFKWSIDPNGQEEMAAKLSKDYNLNVLGSQTNERYRAKRRFAFKDHLRKAFKAGIFGHYYFEQVGEIQDDGMWHLTKLAERPPKTIDMFRVAEDGGLISIVQNVRKNLMATSGPAAFMGLPEIPIDRLVGYVWDQEGANWVGRSWMRDCYKNWLIKDRLMRVDAINHERAGGVPYIEAHPGASGAEIDKLNEMAQQFRIGDTAGGAVPSGAKLQVAKGTNSTVVDSIRYHDEAMARSWMLMIMQLGQTETGSRALGRTFIDFWGHGLGAIADWFRDVFNEHVIEDDIDWNWGEDVDQVPLLTYEFDPEIVMTDLASAVKNGIIVTDDELEDYVRKEMGLPDKGTPRLSPTLELQQQQMTQDQKQFEDSQKQSRDMADADRAAQPNSGALGQNSGGVGAGLSESAGGLGKGAPSPRPVTAGALSTAPSADGTPDPWANQSVGIDPLYAKEVTDG